MNIKQLISSYFTGSSKQFRGSNGGYCKISSDITAEPVPKNKNTDQEATSKTQESTQHNDSQKDELGKLVEEIKNRMNKIKSFNQVSEINSYCNIIQQEVKKAVQDGIEHLRTVEKKLIAQIDDYRSSQIRACSFYHHGSTETFLDTDVDLNNSMNEINNLVNSYSTYLKKIKSEPQYEGEKSALMTQARSCLPKMEEMRRRLRKDTFRGKFMIFTPSSFLTSNDQIGILTSIEEDKDILDEGLKNFKMIAKNVFLPNNQSRIEHLYLLDDGKVAIVFKGKRLSVCELENGSEISSLQSQYQITALADLSDGNLALGLKNGDIQIWNHTTNASRKFQEDIPWHGEIYSLKRLTDGNFASVSNDPIRIWNIRSANSVACQAQNTHNKRKLPKGRPEKMGVLSNGNLITCRNLWMCGSAVFIWDASNAELLQYMETTLDDVTDFKVLKNDFLVLGSDNIIQLYDLKQNALIRTLYEDQMNRHQLNILSIDFLISSRLNHSSIICTKNSKKLKLEFLENDMIGTYLSDDARIFGVQTSGNMLKVLMLDYSD